MPKANFFFVVAALGIRKALRCVLVQRGKIVGRVVLFYAGRTFDDVLERLLGLVFFAARDDVVDLRKVSAVVLA